MLLSDVDVVWLRPPETLLTKLLETGADMMSTTDCLSPSADEAKLRSQLTAAVLSRVKQRCDPRLQVPLFSPSSMPEDFPSHGISLPGLKVAFLLPNGTRCAYNPNGEPGGHAAFNTGKRDRNAVSPVRRGVSFLHRCPLPTTSDYPFSPPPHCHCSLNITVPRSPSPPPFPVLSHHHRSPFSFTTTVPGAPRRSI